MRIVAADIGGTHARFSIADLSGEAITLGPVVTLATADHPSLATAWAGFRGQIGTPLPKIAAIAIAAPVAAETIKLTNADWTIRPASLATELSLDDILIVNDFGAMAHAVARIGPDHLDHVCGPSETFPTDGMISVIGPGTGLGVAALLRHGGRGEVIETEGGHITFAPQDAVEDAICSILRRDYGRVSVERLASGPGLANIFKAMAECAGETLPGYDDATLWARALAGVDQAATAALDRFCLILGSVAGDIALAQGAAAVVLTSGLARRLAPHLAGSGFEARFVAKGRFQSKMARMPIELVTHPEPGLFGAAAAYAAHRDPPEPNNIRAAFDAQP